MQGCKISAVTPQILPTLRHTQNPSLFNRSKGWPKPSACDSRDACMRQAQSTFFLESDPCLPLLWQMPSNDALDLHLVTMNVLDPWVAQFDDTLTSIKTDLRFERIAKAFAWSCVDLLNTQESHIGMSTRLNDLGYQSMGADIGLKRGATLEKIRQDTEEQVSYLGRLSKNALHAKRSWSGLMTHFNPKVFQINNQRLSEFRAYSGKHQKSWPHALGATWASLLASCFKPAQAFHHFYTALVAYSGMMRTDGVQITHLKHQLTQEPVVVLNTHIESFDKDIAKAQIHELVEEVRSVISEYPDTHILLSGDFNADILPKNNGTGFSVSDYLFQQLGAQTMPCLQIENTLVGQERAIDGVFVIPNQSSQLVQIQGRTLFPGFRDACDLELSDHKAVAVQCRLQALNNGSN